ncbi:hypothetical protein EZS27_034736, partial [termite gut metagenome]
MRWIKKLRHILQLLLLLSVIEACTVSYKFNGASINYDKVKTISIADFPIKATYVYTPLGTRFNEELKDIFIRQPRLKLVSVNADMEIDGEITGYTQHNEAYFIKENSSAVSFAEIFFSLTDSSGKGSFFVAEKFRVYRSFGYGSTIDGNVLSMFSPAV